MTNYYIDWFIRRNSGWGLIGYHMARQAMLAGDHFFSIASIQEEVSSFTPFDSGLINYLQSYRKKVGHFVRLRKVIDSDAVRFYQLSHSDLESENPFTTRVDVEGAKRIGLIVIEHECFEDSPLERLDKNLDMLVVASQWNYDLLRRRGFPAHKLRIVYQGIDETLFFPYLPARQNDGQFYFYSSGQIGLRKSQDVVLKAFKRFAKDVPQAVLVTNWHVLGEAKIVSQLNFDPIFAAKFPIQNNDYVNFTAGVEMMGIPPHQFIDLGLEGNQQIANIMRKCHAAIFPNRSEGGTNLMAMEAIACGLPVILANGTGQSDLIRLLPQLRELSMNRPLQLQFAFHPQFTNKELYQAYEKNWFWADENELYEKMHLVYRHYAYHAQNATGLAKSIQQFTWKSYYQQLKAIANSL